MYVYALMRQRSDIEAGRLKKFLNIFYLSAFYLFFKVGFKSYLLCVVCPDCSIPQGCPVFRTLALSLQLSSSCSILWVCHPSTTTVSGHQGQGLLFPNFLNPLAAKISRLQELNPARKRCNSF